MHPSLLMEGLVYGDPTSPLRGMGESDGTMQTTRGRGSTGVERPDRNGGIPT